MKIFFLTLLFSSVIMLSSFGQGYELRKSIDLYNSNKFITGNNNRTVTQENIDGSPYLNDEFISGSVYTVQKIQYNEIPLRYNIYNNNIEFKTASDEIQELTNPEIIEKVVMGDIQMVYSPYLMANKNNNGFFIVLEEGKVSLLAKPEIQFVPATQPAGYKDAEPPKFIKKSDEYYLRIGTGQAILISNKKDMIATFPDNQDKIENFVSKNKIKTNKPESLKELVKYYNSL